MATASFYVTDVGHGNCSTIIAERQCAVFDVARPALILDFLSELRVTKVDAVFVSHADADHIGGLIGLLGASAVKIGTVYVNPDAQKQSKLWEDVKLALAEARRDGQIELRTSLNTADPGSITFADFTVEVLFPSDFHALGGPGHERANGGVVTANDQSVALRIWCEDHPSILIAGDITISSWLEVKKEITNLHADVLIMPHHGGLVGKDENDIGIIVEDVLPIYGVISNGRFVHNNPRASSVEALKRHNARIICTQLSNQCGVTGNDGLAPGLPALGRAKKHCCGGTIQFDVSNTATTLVIDKEHADFVDLLGAGAMCRR